jgi:hypothetical protein
MTREVAFEPVEGSINDRIDDAYRAKYGKSPYLSAMIGAQARSATVRIAPRPAGVQRSHTQQQNASGVLHNTQQARR